MTVQPSEDLERELRDPEFAAYYGADQAKLQLAFSLVNAREKIGLTQKQVAERLDVSQPYVAKLEKGDANPTIGRIGSMLALLGLRLLADTEPLLPEPMPSFASYVNALASHQPTIEGDVFSAEVVPEGDYYPWSRARGGRPEPVVTGGATR